MSSYCRTAHCLQCHPDVVWLRSPLPRDTPGAGIESLTLDLTPAPFRWPYRHFVDPAVERWVLAMLAALGRAAALVPVLDYLLDLAAQVLTGC